MKLSSLPRSVRGILTRGESYHGGHPTVDERPKSSRRMEMQGTRAGAWQGTSSQGNTPDPLHPGRTISGPPGWDDETEMPSQAVFNADNTPAYSIERTLIQTKDWPPNRSHNIIAPAAGRKEAIATDAALQTGGNPGHIIRLLPERVFGYANGMLTGQSGSEGFPWNADKDYIPHIPIARQAQGTKGPQKLSDDNVTIPAVFAGNPRP